MAGIKRLDRDARTLNYIVNQLLNPEIRQVLFDDVVGRSELVGLIFDPHTVVYGVFEKGVAVPIGVIFFAGVVPYRDCILYAVIFDKKNRTQGKLTTPMKNGKTICEIVKNDVVDRFGINSATSYVIGKNPVSEHLLGKLGFKKIGVKPQAIVSGGKHRDLSIYYYLNDGKED